MIQSHDEGHPSPFSAVPTTNWEFRAQIEPCANTWGIRDYFIVSGFNRGHES